MSIVHWNMPQELSQTVFYSSYAKSLLIKCIENYTLVVVTNRKYLIECVVFSRGSWGKGYRRGWEVTKGRILENGMTDV